MQEMLDVNEWIDHTVTNTYNITVNIILINQFMFFFLKFTATTTTSRNERTDSARTDSAPGYLSKSTTTISFKGKDADILSNVTGMSEHFITVISVKIYLLIR